MFSWFKQLSLRIKIILLITLFIIASLLLYIAAMAIRYNGFSTSVASFIPDNADIRFLATNVESNWRAFQETGLYEVMNTALTNDKVIRRQSSTLLSENGLPTLEDIEDTRFRQRYSNLISEYWLMRLFGREVGGGISVDNTSGVKIVVATKISFMDFLLKPFLSIFPGAIGVTSVEKDGVKYFHKTLSNGNIYIAIKDNIAIVSNEEHLLISVVSNVSTNDATISNHTAPIWISINCRNDNILSRRFIDTFNSFPINVVFHFIELNDIKHTEICIDCQNDKLSAAVSLRIADGNVSNISKLSALANYDVFRQNGFVFFESYSTNNYLLWNRLKSYLIAKSSASKNEIEHALGDTLKALIDSGFESKFISQLDNSGCIVIDSEEFTFSEENGQWTGHFPTIAFVAPVSNKSRAVTALDEVAQNILSKNPRLGSMSKIYYNNCDIHFFDRSISSFEIANIVNPYYTEVNGYIVLTTSKSLILKMIDILLTAKQQNKGSNIDLSNIYIDTAKVVKATEGLVHIIAEQTVNTSDNRKLKRMHIEKAEKNTGGNLGEFAEHIDDLVRTAIAKERMEKETALKQNIRFLDYIDGLGIKMQTNTDAMSADVTIFADSAILSK